MSLTPHQHKAVEDFRTFFEAALARDARFTAGTRDDRPDGSTLASRWPSSVNPRVMFEIAVRPFLPQVRVAVLTDDRWKSEDFEGKIQESGDTMSEFVGLGFEEAGLEWSEPPVEHYREQMKYFYFATPIELKSLDELAQDTVRIKSRKMLEGYYRAFQPYLKG